MCTVPYLALSLSNIFSTFFQDIKYTGLKNPWLYYSPLTRFTVIDLIPYYKALIILYDK